MPKINVLIKKINRKIDIDWLSLPNPAHQQIHLSYIRYLLSFVLPETPPKPDHILIIITIVVAAVVEVETPDDILIISNGSSKSSSRSRNPGGNKCICILTVHIEYCKWIKYSIITVILT